MASQEHHRTADSPDSPRPAPPASETSAPGPDAGPGARSGGRGCPFSFADRGSCQIMKKMRERPCACANFCNTNAAGMELHLATPQAIKHPAARFPRLICPVAVASLKVGLSIAVGWTPRRWHTPQQTLPQPQCVAHRPPRLGLAPSLCSPAALYSFRPISALRKPGPYHARPTRDPRLLCHAQNPRRLVAALRCIGSRLTPWESPSCLLTKLGNTGIPGPVRM